MRKEEFLSALAERLSALSQENREERVNFYREAIEDRMEDGIAEEQAVAELGDMESIVSQILADLPLSPAVTEKIARRPRRGWEIALLILGAPLWLSVLAALFAVIVSVLAVMWSVVAGLWATEISLIAAVPACLGGAIIFLCVGDNILSVLLAVSAGLVTAGLAVFLFFGCKYTTKGIWIASKWIFRVIGKSFGRKENAK